MSHDVSFSDVRSRIREGKNVPIGAVAEHGGYPLRTLRSAIKRGEIRAIKVGKSIVLPPDEAGRVLGLEALEAA